MEDDTAIFLQCISADFKMGAGIAVQFEKRYKYRDYLLNKYPNFVNDFQRGTAIDCDKTIQLITKKNYWHKPTYQQLRNALSEARQIIDLRGLSINKVVMPKIGCGLDRLDWEIVKVMIKDIFQDTDLEIVVCYL